MIAHALVFIHCVDRLFQMPILVIWSTVFYEFLFIYVVDLVMFEERMFSPFDSYLFTLFFEMFSMT